MFDYQELIYLAMGQRALARESREQAEKAEWGTIKLIHEKAATGHEELAAKCERLSKELGRRIDRPNQ